MQTTTAPYYSHPGPPGLAQAPIGTGGSIGVSGSGPIPGSSVSAGATGTSGGDPLAQRVSHLLSRAYNLPCSAAAQAFTQLVQPIARFQLALDVLLPLFLDTIVPVSDLLSLYPHTKTAPKEDPVYMRMSHAYLLALDNSMRVTLSLPTLSLPH